MKAMLKTMGGCAALALVMTWLTASMRADDKSPPSPADLVKAMEEAGKPGSEHAKLQPLVGSWTYTGKFWMNPSQPPMESKGTIERKWILDGRFLLETVAGTRFDGKPGFEGFGVVGYDNGRKQFTSSWICNMGTGTHTGVGASDSSGDKLTFQTEAFCPLQKKTIKGREEIRVESNDRVVAESYVIEDGKEIKMMELVSTRKK